MSVQIVDHHPHVRRVRKGSPHMPPFKLLLIALATALSSRVAFPQDAPTPPVARPSVSQAEALLNGGKTADALTLLNELAKNDPQTPRLEASLGKAYFQSRKFSLAIDHLNKALRQNPDDLEATQILALSFYGSGDYAQAAPLLEKLGPRLPSTNADGPYLLGVCYIMTQRWDAARRAFAQLFSVAPESAMAYLMLGKILVRQRMEDRAIPQIEQALQVDPRLPMAHFLLGEIDLYKENPEAAVVEFQKELVVNPTVWLVYWRLGDAYFHLDKLDEAENVLKQAIWLNDSSSGAFILLGQIALKKNDASLAADFLERALKLDPQNFYVHYFLARSYRSLGRSADAARQFEISKSLRSDQHDEERSMLQAIP